MKAPADAQAIVTVHVALVDGEYRALFEFYGATTCACFETMLERVVIEAQTQASERGLSLFSGEVPF